MDLESLPWYGQFAVFLVIGAVLFGFFYFLYYSPQTDKIASIVTESEKLEGEIRIAERNETKLRKLEEDKMRDEAVLENLKTILPDKKEVEQILRRIQSVSVNARLRILEFKPQQARQKEIYEEWPFQMSFEGSYHNVAIFLDQLSRLTKIFNIDSLTLKPLTKMTSEYNINANCVATTYIYKEVVAPTLPQKGRQQPMTGGQNQAETGGTP